MSTRRNPQTPEGYPRIYNRRSDRVPPQAIYVGRPTKYGNPWSHLPTPGRAQYHVATRAEAVKRYELWLSRQPDLIAEIQRELVGRDLVCWCWPAVCHAEVLRRIANGPPPLGFRER